MSTLWRRYFSWSALGTALAIVWALGVAVGIARLLIGAVLVWRLKRSSELSDSARVLDAATNAADLLGLPGAPEIRVSSLTVSPMVVGIVRPAILLPSGMEERLDDAQLAAALLHETGHIAHRDTLIGLLQRVAATLFWWSPLVHLVNRRLDDLREDICDNYVIRAQGDGFRLAQVLVDVAERAAGVSRMRWIGAMAMTEPTGKGLDGRVRRLLQKDRSTVTRMNLAALCATGAFAVLLGGAMLATTVCAAEKQTPEERTIQHGELVDGGRARIVTQTLRKITAMDGDHWKMVEEVAPIVTVAEPDNLEVRELVPILRQVATRKSSVTPMANPWILILGPTLDTQDNAAVTLFEQKGAVLRLTVDYTSALIRQGVLWRNITWRPLIVVPVPQTVPAGQYSIEVTWRCIDQPAKGAKLPEPIVLNTELLLAFASVESKIDPRLIDAKRAKRATVVMRVHHTDKMGTAESYEGGVEQGVGDYVNVVDVYKNEGPDKELVARRQTMLWHDKQDLLPVGQFTAYLVPVIHEKGPCDYRFIGGKAFADQRIDGTVKEGSSHFQKGTPAVWLAGRIVMVDARDLTLEYLGTPENQDGIKFSGRLNDRTVVITTDGKPGTLDDLKTNQWVKVMLAEKMTDNPWLSAVRIERSVAPWAEPASSSGVAPDESWGPVSNGIQTRLVVERTPVELGEPVAFRIEMRNAGNVDQSYDGLPVVFQHSQGLLSSQTNLAIWLSVRGPNGEDVICCGVPVPTLGTRRTLKPGGTLVLFDDLYDGFLWSSTNLFTDIGVVTTNVNTLQFMGLSLPGLVIPPSNIARVEYVLVTDVFNADVHFPTASDRAAKLRLWIKKFTLDLRYCGLTNEHYRSLVLSVPSFLNDTPIPRGDQHIQITREQAGRIIDYLATEGFRDLYDITMWTSHQKPPKGPTYVLRNIGAGVGHNQYQDLGWGLAMIRHLEGLRKVLDGDAAKAMDGLLDRLSDERREWEKQDGATMTEPAADLVRALAAPSNDRRTAAAAALRALLATQPAAAPNRHDQAFWEQQLTLIKPGMTKEQAIQTLLPDATPDERRQARGFDRWGVGIGTITYRLDDYWTVTLPLVGDLGNVRISRDKVAVLTPSVRWFQQSQPANYTGTWTTYFANGQKAAEIQYRDGKPDGAFINYYDNGAKKVEQHYVAGVEHGLDTGWHPNGQKEYEGRYDNYKPVGTWRWWDANGKLTREEDRSPAVETIERETTTIQHSKKQDDAPWGEAVEGVQVRLRTEKTVWTEGEHPVLKMDARYNGARQLYATTTHQGLYLEVDGNRYVWDGPTNESVSLVDSAIPQLTQMFHSLAEFDVKRPRQNVPVPLGRAWFGIGVQPLKWFSIPSGKHIIRVEFVTWPANESKDRLPPFVRAVSNPVEIEIASVVWGESKGGIRIGLSPARIAIGTNGTFAVRVWFENVGDKPAKVPTGTFGKLARLQVGDQTFYLFDALALHMKRSAQWRDLAPGERYAEEFTVCLLPRVPNGHVFGNPKIELPAETAVAVTLQFCLLPGHPSPSTKAHWQDAKTLVSGAVTVTNQERSVTPTGKADGWSEVNEGLRGRLVIAQPKFAVDGWLQALLELENVGKTQLLVRTRNPFDFQTRVTDAAGKEIPPTSSRADVSYQEQFSAIPVGQRLSVPVTIESLDGAKGSQVDTTTEIWRLPPGKYRFGGAFLPSLIHRLPPRGTWLGQLTLPVVPFEVVAAGPGAQRDAQLKGILDDAAWQVMATNALAVAAVERTLYERANDPHFYIRVRLTNTTDRPIGVDLRDYWRVIYPNQWGISREPRRGAIDERRRQDALLPIALFLDFADGKFTRLAPGEAADYYREFNASGRPDIEAQAQKVAGTHLVVSLDGTVPVTEGKGVEPLSCVWDGDRSAAITDLILPLPVKWAALPANVRIISEPATAATRASRALAPFYRNGWHGWPVGTEVRATFLDDKVEGWYSYVQPDLVYRLTETALTRTQVVDGKPVVQQFDPANETGWQPAYLHKLPTAKTTPTTIEIDGVKIECLLYESTMDHIGRDVGGTTVLKEWVLATHPSTWLRTEVNQNYKVIKSLREMKQVGGWQVACVVVEERMEMSGGHQITTSWLSSEVPGHMVEKISETWLEGRQQRTHERMAEMRLPATKEIANDAVRQAVAKVAVEWTTAALAGNETKAAALSDVPFSWDGKDLLPKGDDLLARIRREMKPKDVPADAGPANPFVETGESAADALKTGYLGKEDGLVVVRVQFKGHKVMVFVRPDTQPKVVGFRD